MTSYLPGWLVAGVGVGLALPNLMAGATHDLPPHQSATGSGIVTMARQIGFVIGVSILFAVVGHQSDSDLAGAFVNVWWVSSGVLVLAAATALGMATTPATRPVPA